MVFYFHLQKKLSRHVEPALFPTQYSLQRHFDPLTVSTLTAVTSVMTSQEVTPTTQAKFTPRRGEIKKRLGQRDGDVGLINVDRDTRG